MKVNTCLGFVSLCSNRVARAKIGPKKTSCRIKVNAIAIEVAKQNRRVSGVGASAPIANDRKSVSDVIVIEGHTSS